MKTADEPHRAHLEVMRQSVDQCLRALAPADNEQTLLSKAVNYALLAPGKRVRPMLTLLAMNEFGSDPLEALHAGCALEMVHAASLVMDDLPAMDNATWRRGQPTTYKAFGEDVALLASVALVARAHATVAEARRLPAETRCELVAIIARTVGESGLALGQLRDLRAPSNVEVGRIAEANHLKTGVLFVAAIDIAVKISGVSPIAANRLRIFARHFGQAYQMLDDLADGRKGPSGVGLAEDENRITLLSRLGQEQVMDRLRSHVRDATDQLEPGGQLLAFVRQLFGTLEAARTPELAAAAAS